jgi:amino acid transporter
MRRGRRPWRALEPGIYEVTERPEPRTSAGRALRWLNQRLFGPAYSNALETRERLSRPAALGVLGADSIASSVYGPEAMMRALVPGGLAAIALSTHLSWAIVTLLAILVISYLQTIRAFPSGAGTFLVTRDSLGGLPSLVASSALMIDYVLDVAVSVAAGVQSLTSIFGALLPHRVAVCLLFILILTIGNLRGVRTSGLLFAGPIYLYVGCCLALIGIGLVRSFVSGLPLYQPTAADAEWVRGSSSLGLFLLLRAFASGAVALTGVEAISNGVPIFRPPEARNAKITLIWMAVLFGILFLGIAGLAAQIRVLPDPHEAETVLSRIAATLTGRGPFLYLLQLATALVLALAANTGYADFPRLAYLMARDRILPPQFAHRGQRLAFDRGIVVLSALVAVLVILFRGSLSALIPLFTIGVFVAFTLSQLSMVRHWWRRREDGWRKGLLLNGLGAAVCIVVAVIEAVTKFTEGAWIVVAVMPLLTLGFLAMRNHLHAADAEQAEPLIERATSLWVMIVVSGLDRPGLKAIAFAKTAFTSAERIEAVHVSADLTESEALKRRWDEAAVGVPLVILQSPYRELVRPLLTYIDSLEAEGEPSGRMVTVVVPEAIPPHWWQRFLHTEVPLLLRSALMLRPGTAVMSVPYHLRTR